MAAALDCLWTGALRIDAAAGDSGTLVLAFSSIGHDPPRRPAPEFLATATRNGNAALFITDRDRSWANTPDFTTALSSAVATMRARGPVDRILAMGVSMGGFAALVAATFLPVTATLTFGAQFSIASALMPQETRWRDWTARIDRLHWPSAPLAPGTRHHLFHALTDDRHQALAFPEGPLIDHYLFPDLAHSDLAAHLRGRGVLAGLVDGALTGDRRRMARIAASAGGRRRARLMA
jgi:dienelactone hydrolase